MNKEQLELEKLQLEISYLHRNFALQSAKALALLLAGLFAFYYFQRPQLSQLEAGRLSSERQHIATLLLNAQGLPNENDREKTIELLRKIWPDHEFLAKIAGSYAVPKTDPQQQSDCLKLLGITKRLLSAKDELMNSLRIEIEGKGLGSVPGTGSVAQSYVQRIVQLDAQLDSHRQVVEVKGCRTP